ncbi:hypothetical protein AB0O34_22485 [Sphaerisporangium sp. NPDC088356]|uniref:hypothetical protein n=1 Tax=Sphaerisporangium sp. NPDC088356 TaxID=3154871 RepID=UPI0034251B52
MTRHGAERPLAEVPAHVRRLTLAALVIAAAGAVASPSQASAGPPATSRGSLAAVLAGDHGPVRMRDANGKHNTSYSQILSPIASTGLQNVSNTSVGGNSHTESAVCKKKVRICEITQKLRTRLERW